MLAWEVLRAVDERSAYANLLLPRMLRERKLDERDSAFATELAYGTLRAQGLLDGLIAGVSSRPPEQLDPQLRDALRLGAYQLARTRVPARAAVTTTVELVRATAGERPVGFANAVMRRLADRLAPGPAGPPDIAALVGAPAAADDPIGRLAAEHAHPRWIAAAFAAALGGDLAETAAALAADNDRPVTHLVARPGRMYRDQLLREAEAAGFPADAGRWSPYAVVLRSGDPARLASVRAGRSAVQDEGSQLVVAIAAAAPTAGSDVGLTVDLCAGPGGKTALLGGLLADVATRLVGVELRPTRARLVARTGVPVVVGDGRRFPFRPGSADRVLVDAPCTGLGALRRRPEARWRRQPEDVAQLVVLQRELLVAALELVRPGGVVVYATCSPHPAETVEVVESVTAERLDARAFVRDVPDLGDGPYVQLWPHRHGTDAMFVAVLRRPEGS